MAWFAAAVALLSVSLTDSAETFYRQVNYGSGNLFYPELNPSFPPGSTLVVSNDQDTSIFNGMFKYTSQAHSIDVCQGRRVLHNQTTVISGVRETVFYYGQNNSFCVYNFENGAIEIDPYIKCLMPAVNHLEGFTGDYNGLGVGGLSIERRFTFDDRWNVTLAWDTSASGASGGGTRLKWLPGPPNQHSTWQPVTGGCQATNNRFLLNVTIPRPYSTLSDSYCSGNGECIFNFYYLPAERSAIDGWNMDTTCGMHLSGAAVLNKTVVTVSQDYYNFELTLPVTPASGSYYVGLTVETEDLGDPFEYAFGRFLCGAVPAEPTEPLTSASVHTAAHAFNVAALVSGLVAFCLPRSL